MVAAVVAVIGRVTDGGNNGIGDDNESDDKDGDLGDKPPKALTYCSMKG